MFLFKNESVAEFTFKSVFTGIILGIVFGAANAYLGLRVGLTVSASIPAAVVAVALFKVFSKNKTILEVNISQTIGSASTSLASGAIFTIPALFMWGVTPPYFQIVALCFLGGLLGLSAMIPLRKLLIVDSHNELPYLEGTACAEVLRATSSTSTAGRWIFYGMAIGAAVKLILSVVFLMPSNASFLLPILPKAQLALELAPALIGVGFILGYRGSGILFAGSLISAVVLTPLIAWFGGGGTAPFFPEMKSTIAEMNAGAIWSKYVRYIGAGAIASAGILTVLKNMPTMYGALSAVIKGIVKKGGNLVGGEIESTERDLPATFVVGAILIVLIVAAFVPGVFAGDMPLKARIISAIGVAIFGILFVAVAARIVGIVGVSTQPTSGITLVTLLCVATIFVANGWNDMAAHAAVLTVGTIVAIAASKAGDISQDLKTGFLVGATPAKQQFGQLIGLAFACWAVAATIFLLGSAYEFGSTEIPAPQATLMKTIIEGVLSGNLPWELVLMGTGLGIGAMICGISALAFAIGVYLPIASMFAIFIGGVTRWVVDVKNKDKKKSDHDTGILAASGLVAGEGLAGILVAAMVAFGLLPKSKETILTGDVGTSVFFLFVGVVCLFVYYAGMSKKE